MRANVGRDWRRWLLPLAICVLTVIGSMTVAVTSPRVAYAAPQGSINDGTVTFNDASDVCGDPGAGIYTVPSNAQVLQVVAVGGAGQDGASDGGSSGSGGHGGQVTAYIEVSPTQTQLGVQVGSSTGNVPTTPLGQGGKDSGENTFGGGASGVSTDCKTSWPVVAGGGGAGGDGNVSISGGQGGDGCATAVNAPAGVSCAASSGGGDNKVLSCGGAHGGNPGSDAAGGSGGGGGSCLGVGSGSGGGTGSFMQGGDGGANHGVGTDGGAGGGGYYGGGGGGGGTEFGAGGGGGGGDSYVSPTFDLAGFLGSATPQIQPASGKSTTGSVTITPIVISTTADGAAASTSDTSVTLTAHAFVSSPSPAPGPVNNGKIEFSVNGTFYYGPVDSSGTATVTVPLSGLTAGTYTYGTVYNLPDGDTILSSQNTGTLFVTAPGVSVTGINSATANNSSATASTGTPSGGGQPDISATVTGTGTITVADYSADPVSTALPTGGSYFDVHATTGSSFTSATIVRCNVGTSTTAYWWNGSSWAAAAPQSYDPSTGCITVGPLDSSSTSPTTAQLNGTPLGVTPTPTTVTVSPETVKYSQTTPLSATVAVSSPYQAVSTASIAGTVDFTLGAIDLGSVSVSSAVGASSVTANLIASPAILQTPSSTAYTITATFTPSSGSYYDGSSGTGALTVIHDDSALTYTGPVVIANGQPATLSATMTANGGAAQVSGRTLTFTLGSGGSAQQCTAATTSSGVGTCTIPKVNQPVGPGSVSVSFAGDADYLPSSASASAMYYSYASAWRVRRRRPERRHGHAADNQHGSLGDLLEPGVGNSQRAERRPSAHVLQGVRDEPDGAQRRQHLDGDARQLVAATEATAAGLPGGHRRKQGHAAGLEDHGQRGPRSGAAHYQRPQRHRLRSGRGDGRRHGVVIPCGGATPRTHPAPDPDESGKPNILSSAIPYSSQMAARRASSASTPGMISMIQANPTQAADAWPRSGPPRAGPG